MMSPIIYMLFIACIQSTIPNRHTLHYLPEEQREVLIEYANTKCLGQVHDHLNQEPKPRACREKMGEQPLGCM